MYCTIQGINITNITNTVCHLCCNRNIYSCVLKEECEGCDSYLNQEMGMSVSLFDSVLENSKSDLTQGRSDQILGKILIISWTQKYEMFQGPVFNMCQMTLCVQVDITPKVRVRYKSFIWVGLR